MNLTRWVKGRVISAVVTWVLRLGLAVLGIFWIKRLQRKKDEAEARLKTWRVQAEVSQARAKTLDARRVAKAIASEVERQEGELATLDVRLDELAARKANIEKAISSLDSRERVEDELDQWGV